MTLYRSSVSGKQWACVILVMGILILLNHHLFWSWVYPIDYVDEVALASEKFDADPYLVLAVIQSESVFKQESVSRSGAMGVMQLMPDTATWVNQQSGLDFPPEAYIYDAEANLYIGTWYLAYLTKKYDGEFLMTLAAYNAGEGNVDRWVNNGVWDGQQETINQIPYGETRHYIRRVLFFHEKYQSVYANYF